MPKFESPDDPAVELAEIKRRLHALETAPQSNMISLLDGTLRFRTASNEDVQALMGTDAQGNDIGFWVFVDDAGVATTRGYLGTGSSGLDANILLSNRDGRLIFYGLSNWGLYRPVLNVSWVKNPSVLIDAAGNALTASGSYDTMYRTWLNCAVGVRHEFAITLGAGVTSVDFKLTGKDDFGGGVETTIYEQTGITSNTNIVRTDAIPSLMADGLAVPGAFIGLRAYLRISGGAGNGTLAPIFPAIPTTSV